MTWTVNPVVIPSNNPVVTPPHYSKNPVVTPPITVVTRVPSCPTTEGSDRTVPASPARWARLPVNQQPEYRPNQPPYFTRTANPLGRTAPYIRGSHPIVCDETSRDNDDVMSRDNGDVIMRDKDW